MTEKSAQANMEEIPEIELPSSNQEIGAPAEKIKLIRYYQALRDNRNYRLLWIAFVISLFGDWFNELASLTLINRYWDSPNAVALFLNSRDLASFLFSPLAGVLVDRYNRKMLLVASDVTRMFIVLQNLWVHSSGTLPILFACAFSQMAVSSVFNTGVEALTPELVDPKDLLVVNILSGSTWSSSLLLGAALGGFFTFQFGVAWNFVFDALSYLGSAVTISRIELPAKKIDPDAGNTENYFKSFYIGLQFLWKHKLFFVLSMAKAVGGFVWNATDVVVVVAAHQDLLIGTDGSVSLSLIYSLSGLGVLIGPYIAQSFFADTLETNKNMLIWSFVLIAIGCLGAAAVLLFIPWFVAKWIAFGIFNIIRALGSGWTWIYSSIILQKLVPNSYLGRVSATQFGLFPLFGLTTRVFVGLMLSSISVGWVFAIYGVICTVISAMWVGLFKYYEKDVNTEQIEFQVISQKEEGSQFELVEEEEIQG